MKKLQKTIDLTPFAIPIVMGVFAVVTLVIALLSMKRVDQYLSLRADQVRNEAIDLCAQNSRYTYTETNKNTTRVTEEPSQDFYNNCLKLKNVR
jgi:hypothetical protein